MSEALPVATFLAFPKLLEVLVHRDSVAIICNLKMDLDLKTDKREPG